MGYCTSIQYFSQIMLSSTPVSGLTHPCIFRVSQLARGYGRTTETGCPVLPAELPRGNWLADTLVDLPVHQAGVAECRLPRRQRYRSPIQLLSPCERAISRDVKEEPQPFLHGLSG